MQAALFASPRRHQRPVVDLQRVAAHGRGNPLVAGFLSTARCRHDGHRAAIRATEVRQTLGGTTTARASASRSSTPASTSHDDLVTSTDCSARSISSTSSTRRRGLRRLRPRRQEALSRATGSTRGRSIRHRAGSAPRRAQGARRRWPRTSSDVIAALDYVVARKDAFNIAENLRRHRRLRRSHLRILSPGGETRG